MKGKSSLLAWVDERFPLSAWIDRNVMSYYVPKNLNFWYVFGGLALLVLLIQVASGIFLAMHYKPDASLNAAGVPAAFASVEAVMRDVHGGAILRVMHSTGASAFFFLIYLHLFRSLLYGSYRKPRELVWIIGCLIFLALMAESFFGYLLPWGQMSFWGAQVIINLFGAIPVIGPDLALWIRGDFVVSDATLSRFFVLHLIAVPLVLIALVGFHLLALHAVGSNNPDGVEVGSKTDASGVPLDGIPFHPYYTVKDFFCATLFLLLFAAILFFAPEGGGYLLEPDNFVAADPLKTPTHLSPLWYFAPFFSMLRAVTPGFLILFKIGVSALALWAFVAAKKRGRILIVLAWGSVFPALFLCDVKFWGGVTMAASVFVLVFLPWLDRSPVRSMRYKGIWSRLALAIFALAFVLLGFLGTRPLSPVSLFLAQLCTAVHFLFFALMPLYSTRGASKGLPERLTWK